MSMESENLRKVVYSIRHTRLEDDLGTKDPWIHLETLYLALADLTDELTALRMDHEEHTHPGLADVEGRDKIKRLADELAKLREESATAFRHCQRDNRCRRRNKHSGSCEDDEGRPLLI
jgi:hypothetical protein